eukprot:440941_1
MLSCSKNNLTAMVRRATNIEDIMPIVNEIRLETIQQLAIQHIDTLNTNSLRQLTCKATSINDIFSSDIIQYILSFTNNIDPYTNLVCKTWDVLSNKNKVKYAKDLYSSTGPNEQQRNKMPYNYQHNTTYIIDQSRKTLFAAEEQKGYQMDPYFNTKYYNFYNYQHGDRIFILNQGDKQPMIDGEITADIQIIGTKNRATLGYIKITAAADYEQDYEEYIPSKVYLEGITVTTINLRAHCSLWMQNCIIGDIFVCEGANLNLDNCEVKGKLQITPFADNVSITNCKLGNIYIRTSAGEEFTNGSGDLNIEWSLYLS